MEANDNNQLTNPVETPVQPSQHSVNNQRGNFPIVLGVLVLLFVVGGGAYYLGIQRNNSQPSQVNNPSSTTNQTNEVSSRTTAPVTIDNVNEWKTYTDEKLKYRLQYAPNPLQPMRTEGDTSFIVGYFINGGNPNNFQDVQNSEKTYWISLGYISESQLSVMGIDYCGANTNDSSRCGTITVNGVNSLIDWGIPIEYTKINSNEKTEKATQLKAFVKIPHPAGGIVTIELQPVVPKSKEALYKMLSTFQFTN